jgi:hypothetical protein
MMNEFYLLLQAVALTMFLAVFNKVDVFTENLMEGIHNLDANTVKFYLSNTAPVVTNTIKANVAEISAGNGYTAGGVDILNATSRTNGTTIMTGVDQVVTATGGTIGPFRYVPLYDDTPTSPADPLIGWWDYGSSITLADGETFTVDFGASILSLT